MRRREFLKYGAVLGAVVPGSTSQDLAFNQVSAAQVPEALASGGWRGDLALVNARIMTVDSRQPKAEAALVRSGRIVLVGSTSDVKAQARGARIFDAQGRAVVPGFIDAHCHIEVAASGLSYTADVHSPPVKDISDLQRILRAKAAITPKGEWVVGRAGFGMDRSLAEKRLPLRAELDAVSEDHPVIVFSGRHITMTNTYALKTMGIWDANSKLPMGTLVHRDASGVPTGICTEVFYYLPAYSLEQMKVAMKSHAPALCTDKGTTTIYAIPFSGNDVRADIELQRSRELPLRIRMFYHVPHMLSYEDLMGTGFVSGIGDDMFRVGGMKLFVDGAGSDGLGHPYADLKWTQQELNNMVSGADEAGMQVLMHVVTSAGYKMATDAIAEARHRNPHQPYIIHRIEHRGDDGTAEGIVRMRELGFRVAITPDKREPTQNAARNAGPRYRTLVSEHLEPALITDTTGTTIGQSDIMQKIACMVATPEEGGGTSRDETLSFEEALRLFTLGNAQIGYEDQYKGSITPGKLGDFAILSGDPRGMPPAKLFDLKVEATILGGEVVFGAGG